MTRYQLQHYIKTSRPWCVPADSQWLTDGNGGGGSSWLVMTSHVQRWGATSCSLMLLIDHTMFKYQQLFENLTDKLTSKSSDINALTFHMITSLWNLVKLNRRQWLKGVGKRLGYFMNSDANIKLSLGESVSKNKFKVQWNRNQEYFSRGKCYFLNLILNIKDQMFSRFDNNISNNMDSF